MNITALTALLLSTTGSIAIYTAMRQVALQGLDRVCLYNRVGVRSLEVEYSHATGFIFSDKKGCDVTPSVLSLLKQTV